MPTIGEINVEITATTSRLRANLAQASSLIRDWSLLATGLGQGVTTAFSNIATIGMKAITISAAALIGTFGLIAASGADFQDKITRAFIITQESSGATAESFALVTEEAIRLGNETLFSANQAAEGFLTLARAGFDVEQQITSLQSIIDLGVAGNLSLAASADITIASLFGFGLEANETSKIADVLSLASAKANTTVELLGSAMSFVAPVAAAAGVSFETTATALGIMANAGIRGSRGGTTLRRALSQLLAPTRQAREVMDDLGVTFTNSRGKLKPFVKIIRDLEKSGITAAQTMKLFGLRAGPGMAALIRIGSSAFSEFESALKGSEGAADRMAQKMRETIIGRVKDLGATVIATGLAFSTQFDKGLANVIFSLRNYVKETTEALQKTKIFKAIVDGVINALSPLSDKITELAQKFQEFLTGLTPGDVAGFFDEIREKVQEVVDAFSDPTNIQIFVNSVKALGSIIGSVVSGVTMLVTMFKNLPPIIQENIGPITIVSGIILAIVGGLSNIVILVIAVRALILTLASGAAVWAGIMLGVVIIAKLLLIALAAIAGIVIATTFIPWARDLEVVEITIGKIVAGLRVAGTLAKVVALQAASANPLQGQRNKIANEKRLQTARDQLALDVGVFGQVDEQTKANRAKREAENNKGPGTPNILENVQNILGNVKGALGTESLNAATGATKEQTDKFFTNLEQTFDSNVAVIRGMGNQIQILDGKVEKFRGDVEGLLRQKTSFQDSVDSPPINAER